MKKFTTLMATSAAVLGLAGSLTAVNADAISDLQNAINNSTYASQSGSTRFKGTDDWSADSVYVYNDGQTILQASNALKQDPNLDVNDALSQSPNTNLRGFGKDAAAKKADTCNTIEKDKLHDDAVHNGSDYTNRVNDLAALEIAAINELYSNKTENAASNSSSKANNDVKAPAQQATTSSNSKANNDVKTPAQQATTSSNSKANNDVKAPAQQATTSNSSKANNGVKATAQNTTANGAVANNNENTNAAGKTTTTADTQQANNNGTVSTTTQNSNANVVSTPAEMHQAAQQATSNTTAVPTMPQTGEQGSEILAIAGGLVIAATAAGIVVYKKRN